MDKGKYMYMPPSKSEDIKIIKGPQLWQKSKSDNKL